MRNPIFNTKIQSRYAGTKSTKKILEMSFWLCPLRFFVTFVFKVGFTLVSNGF